MWALSFALLLAAQGIASTIVERNKYPKLSPKEDAKEPI